MIDRPIGKLEITPDVERLTVGQRAPVQRRADVVPEARPLSAIPVTPRLILLCAYLDAFHDKGWNHERTYDVCRALGFKPQDIVDAKAVIAYRKNR